MPDASSLLSKARRQQMGSSKASAYELLSADQAMATRQSGMGEAAPGVAADPMECRVGDGPRARRLEGLMAMNVFEEGGGRDAYPAPFSVLHRKKFSWSKSNLTQQPSNWRKGETAEDQKAAAARAKLVEKPPERSTLADLEAAAAAAGVVAPAAWAPLASDS
jgi:hypothetical protein